MKSIGTWDDENARVEVKCESVFQCLKEISEYTVPSAKSLLLYPPHPAPLYDLFIGRLSLINIETYLQSFVLSKQIHRH